MEVLLEKIDRLLSKTLFVDSMAAKRRINYLLRGRGKKQSIASKKQKLSDLIQRLESSAKVRQDKIDTLPQLKFDPELPICAKKDEIIAKIQKHQVVIVSGETGSGKTTQLPKFCLAAGRGIDGVIGCTQPRRIAAITVSQRIAEELGQAPGESVGYKIRFQDKSSKTSHIKLMTDGILLAETQNDPWLNEYDTIIVDEAHERSLNIDFVLGILKSLIAKRKQLKLIITSATIDTQKFSAAFGNAPVVEVSGRMFPVTTHYLSAKDMAGNNGEESLHVEQAVAILDRIVAKRPFGDVLIFMPTEQDIRETIELISGRNYKGTTVLPLFARLSATEQQKVFGRPSGRKIIVATNVAETSLTIPGIKYVIDSGLARISQYNPTSRTTALPVTPISRSSADQRMGRCGRVENGVCHRLFTEDDYKNRPRFTIPEILRSNLAEVILRMIALNLGNAEDFPFIDPPVAKNIADGTRILQELDAIAPVVRTKRSRRIAGRFQLTEKGRLMAKLPLDPRLSRMLLEGDQEGCLAEIVVLAAALSIQDPKERPLEKQAEADQAHAIFNDPRSDFFSLLNIWDAYQNVRRTKKGWGGVKAFCRENFLSFRRMREWCDIHGQIWLLLEEEGFQKSSVRKKDQPEPKAELEDITTDPVYAAVHRAVLSGFLSNIAVKKEKQFFRATRERETMIFPGSALFKQPGNWVVAAEMVETSRLFARTVAQIDSAWLEELGKNHCRSNYFDPRWHRSQANVIIKEQVTLFGLPIVSNRPVIYGRIDPDAASAIFIQQALVEQDMARPLPFMQHNQNLIDSVREMEDRVRRRDILIAEDAIVQFYQERLKGVYDLPGLKKRIRENGGDGFLRLTKDQLFTYLPASEELALYPEKVSLGNTMYNLAYKFNPEKADDGVTVRIPGSEAAMVRTDGLDWLVPGLLEEKITALIKGLPKTYRKQLVPIAGTVEVVIKEMPQKGDSLRTSLSRFIHQRFKVDVPASAWPEEKLPDHLRMRIAVTDSSGKIIRADRNPAVLKSVVTPRRKNSNLFEELRKKWEKEDIREFPVEEIPVTIALNPQKPLQGSAYPALFVEGERLHLRLFKEQLAAVKAHPQGVAHLLTDRFRREIKFLKHNLILPKTARDAAIYFGGYRKVEDALYESLTSTLFQCNLRTKAQYDAHVKQLASQGLHTFGSKKRDAVCNVLQEYHKIRSFLAQLASGNRANHGLQAFLQEQQQQLNQLLPANFIDLYHAERLGHILRYLTALGIRAQRAVVHLEKDRQRWNEVQPFLDRLKTLLVSLTPKNSEEKRSAVEEFYWMTEEFKISLFAQEVGTNGPISRKRLSNKLKEIDRMV
ncbi:MAG: ATP-dependent RNA helicase HrpA [Desulfobacteraceae bacterium]|jgi:ATP-dependent helicase HrpA